MCQALGDGVSTQCSYTDQNPFASTTQVLGLQM